MGLKSRMSKISILLILFVAHPAFDKACDYFRIKLVRISVDPDSYTVNVVKVRNAINRLVENQAYHSAEFQ